MATSPNATQITPPRVALIDERTGAVSREWYRWFYSLYNIVGGGLGVIPVASGGTGLSTIPTNGQLLIGNGTGYTLNTLGVGVGISVTNGIGTITLANTGVLSNIAGTGISVSGATGNVTIANTGVLSFSGGTTGLTPSAVTTGAITLAGTLVIANGGTNGSATPTAGAVAYGTGTAYGFTAAGTTGQVLTSAGAGVPTWTTPTTGTVTSVGLAMPNQFTVTNSPVTSTGTLTAAWNTQTANFVLAGPTTGAAAVPTFRALVAADIPTLSYVTSVSGTTGRITSTGGTTPVIDLASGVATPGTTGSSTLIPVVTIDTYGRVTSITTAANPQGTVTSVSGTGTVNGITLTGTVTSSGSLTLGGTLSGIGNSQLTNSTISGVSLGSNLFNLTAGTGVSFSSGTTYNGSAAITITATGSGGTVTSVTGTSPVNVATGTTTPVISLASGYGDTQNPYASKTANFVLAAPNGLAGVPTFRALVAADVPGSALTKTDDTNVTLTLGGSPTTALLNAASLTLGWTGTLATTRGGTGLSSFTANGVMYASSTSALATSSNFTYNGTNLYLAGQLSLGSTTTTLGFVDITATSSTAQLGLRITGTNTFAGNPVGLRVGPTLTGTAATVSGTGIQVNHIYTYAAGATVSDSYGIDVQPQLNGTITPATMYGVRSFMNMGASATGGTISNWYQYHTAGAVFNASATTNVTNAYGYYSSTITSGAGQTITNAYAFYGNQASGTGRYNFYAGGTAQNLFSGDVLVFGAGSLGYTTGSGGTVTQGTSRTTGVTLNKTNGAITLFSAAGLATFQSFTVTNSTVAATDVVHVTQKSGTDLYQIFVTATAAGSFRISFATTGGTTTEQPVFNFAVIKAVTA